jgi:hypothetical protein
MEGYQLGGVTTWEIWQVLIGFMGFQWVSWQKNVV